MANKVSKRFKDNAEKRGNNPFIPMRQDVLDSDAWARTSMKGARLIMDLAAQYRGNNNGDLCMSWSVMCKRGWKSQDTLNKAKAELLNKQWIICTRKGSRNVCSLYALTFFAIDECSKHDPDIRPALRPRDSWKAGNAAPADVAEKRQRRTAKIKIPATDFVQPYYGFRSSERE